MKRSTSPLSLLVALSLITATAACAGNDSATADSAAGSVTADSSAPASTAGASTAAADASGALLEPNTASREQLMALPGMTAAIADSIVGARPHQNMLSVERILARTLSEPQRDSIYARMFKPLDLNTASKEEIMLIPGVGERMHHEFEEYRPYDNIAKFRREIAKYVADTTVARYEKYVTIR